MSALPAIMSCWNWTSSVWFALAGCLLVDFAINGWRSDRRRGLVFIAALAFLLTYVSPIGVLANGYLFSAHIVQHLLLLLVVPLYYVLSLPCRMHGTYGMHGNYAMRERFPRSMAGCVSAIFRLPQVGWVCGLGAMWLWHVPNLCHAAAQSESLGSIRDASLLLAGTAFWWPIFAPVHRHRLNPLSACLYLFSACVGCSLLGIYITFATVSVCPIFAHPHDDLGVMRLLREAGFTAAIDQQIGGLLMWVPPCLLYGSVILGLLRTWYLPPAPSFTSHVPADTVRSPALLSPLGKGNG
jgi:cytochrome c oxidase assembly factor CtaG